MSKLFKAFMGFASVAAAGVIAKLCYDYFKNSKYDDILSQEFFEDIEDDFDGMGSDFFEEELAGEKPQANESEVDKTTVSDAGDASLDAGVTKKVTASKKVSDKKELASLTCQDVIDCTSDVMEVSAEDILSKSRKADVANARRIAIYICATQLKVGNAVICEEFGGIGSTSVTNAKKNIGDKIKEDDELAANVEDIIASLKSLENSFGR